MRLEVELAKKVLHEIELHKRTPVGELENDFLLVDAVASVLAAEIPEQSEPEGCYCDCEVCKECDSMVC